MACRTAIFFLALLGIGSAPAQTSVWRSVSTHFDPPQSKPLTLTRKQRVAIRAALLARESRRDVWECGDQSWLDGLRYSSVAAATHPVFLVEAGSGCARGGQGANGAMWLVAWNGASARVLASPNDNFNGWLYSVVSRSHHGFHDIVLGWHMGAFEAGLTYFEFNGAGYKRVSSATWESDDDGNGNGKIIPSPRSTK